MTLDLTRLQLRMMRHCIGLNERLPSGGCAIRNLYIASRSELPAWDELIGEEFAESVSRPSVGLCTFRLTERGIEQAKRRAA